ncbi:RagB/SusD family nutrient uptake outer membrane protein [Chitinophaga sp. Cy-1792]|uniref:RagB/SusD family nutrient uptake outer membrane protein n=1 Tax=Chitinophaga sp. Cy-1792 TaxID=2608339 RepID=UPI0014206B56|nr:RagB/SusD family nutrient uptake outer membrane protein [Chitinophaga sp. Cy-1792]NIG56955.1 RagB/SusD family nutrient uptake outer membrane protein [Chitinophaga sp. Cy-1792]
MKYLNICWIALAALVLSSCGRDYLDIKPKGKVIPSVYKDYRLLLNNAYTLPTSYGSDEWLTDDVEFYESKGLSYLGNSTFKLHTWQNNVYVSGDGDNMWNSLYKQIYIANVVIDGMKTVTDGILTERNQVTGEALVHRAFAYFSLVNLYGMQYDAATASKDLAVPLVLAPTTDQQLNRASVQAVYDQVFADLNLAVTLLGKTSTTFFEPSLATGYAVLARAALATGKYQEALTAATNSLAIKNKLTDYNQFKNDPYSFPINSENQETLLMKLANNAYSWFSVSKDLQVAFKDSLNDLRYQILFTSTQDPMRGYLYYNGEFLQYDTRNLGPTVAEMYLVKAECEARAGDATAALNDMNAVRKARILSNSYQPTTATSADDALVKVLEERRRELCFHGMRLFDLKRLNKDPKFAKTLHHSYNGQQYEIAPNSPMYLFPIAPKLRQLNPEIEPNEHL